MKFKIQGGTAKGDEHLCTNCRYATHMETVRGEEVTLCAIMAERHGGGVFRVKERVSKCSSFDDKSQPELWEMRKMAYYLTQDKKGGIIGFKDKAEMERLQEEGKAKKLEDDR